ncbi:MAG: hypothetical protein ACXWOL_04950 [Ktedonobacteraceae bacterium]
MNAVQHTHTNSVTMRVMWIAVALALLAALSYLLIQLSMFGVGDLQTAEASVIPLVAAGCYLIGGLLILVRRRWLWIVGAVINAFVILIFFMAYLNRPLVMFSAGGLATKIAQLLLELCLLYLIITDWRSTHSQPG